MPVGLGLNIGIGIGPLSSGGAGPAPGPTQHELLLVAGQSLAGTQGVSGATGLPSGWANTARVQIWSPAASDFVTYSPSTAPINDANGSYSNTWGGEVAYAQAWLADAANDNKTLYIVKHWQGGSQLGAIATYGQIGTGNKDWDPNTSSHNFSLFKAKVDAAKAALAGASVSYIIRDMLWVQGETDSRNGSTLADYTANATALYSAIRSQLGTSSTNICAHFISALYADYPRSAMAAKQRELAALSSRNLIVDTLGFTYQGDTIHFAPAGANSFGEAAYALLHGASYAPGTLSLSANAVSANAPAGTVVGFFSASRDGETAYSVIGASNFQVVGLELRVASGATLVAGIEDVNIRATNAAGTQDYIKTISVTAVSSDFLVDEFNGTALGSLTGRAADVGGSWQVVQGSSPKFANGGTAVFSEATASVVANDATPPSANYTVTADLKRVTTIANQTAGVGARNVVGANTLYFFRYNNQTGAWELGKTVTGTGTTFSGSVAATLTNGQTYVVQIVVNNDQISGVVDGATIIGPVTDTSITGAGRAVLRLGQIGSSTTGWIAERIVGAPL